MAKQRKEEIVRQEMENAKSTADTIYQIASTGRYPVDQAPLQTAVDRKEAAMEETEFGVQPIRSNSHY
jgi:hypothetical protein